MVSEPFNVKFYLILTPNIFSLEFVKWILPACTNIHSLTLVSEFERIDACFNIGCLKKLKKLELSSRKASLLKEVPLFTLLITKTLLISSQISRNCHQVEILELSFIEAQLQDFAEFNATNLKEIELVLDEGPSIDEVLLLLVKGFWFCSTS